MDIGREIGQRDMIRESLGHVIEADEWLGQRIRPSRKTLPQRSDWPRPTPFDSTTRESITP